jgi:hypothetical protein
MHDVFDGYHNLLNGTSNMVVHEWAHDLNTGFENLSFYIVGASIMMHFLCLDVNLYVCCSCYLPTYHQSGAKIMFLSSMMSLKNGFLHRMSWMF